MAMVELASRQDCCCRSVSVSEIAAAQQLSQPYLEQLFGRLRRAGLVASARGPGGGYRLARPAGQVSIADIIRAVDEKLRVTRCDAESDGCLKLPDGGQRCPTHDLWHALGRHIDLFLSTVTLEDVVRRRIGPGPDGDPPGAVVAEECAG